MMVSSSFGHRGMEVWGQNHDRDPEPPKLFQSPTPTVSEDPRLLGPRLDCLRLHRLRAGGKGRRPLRALKLGSPFLRPGPRTPKREEIQRVEQKARCSGVSHHQASLGEQLWLFRELPDASSEASGLESLSTSDHNFKTPRRHPLISCFATYRVRAVTSCPNANCNRW